MRVARTRLFGLLGDLLGQLPTRAASAYRRQDFRHEPELERLLRR